MKKLFPFTAMCIAGIMAAACTGKSGATAESAVTEATDSIPTVYYIKDITPENLIKAYQALGRKAEGDKVAVKVSTGE